jgi:hypothetical protein
MSMEEYLKDELERLGLELKSLYLSKQYCDVKIRQMERDIKSKKEHLKTLKFKKQKK